MRFLIVLATLPFASVPEPSLVFTIPAGADAFRSAIADGISRAAMPSALEAKSDASARR